MRKKHKNALNPMNARTLLRNELLQPRNLEKQINDRKALILDFHAQLAKLRRDMQRFNNVLGPSKESNFADRHPLGPGQF